MEFLKLLFNRSKAFYLFMLFLGLLKGAFNVALLRFIDMAVTQSPIAFFPEYDWLLFIGIVFISLLINFFFQSYMVRLTSELNMEFELAVLKKINRASYENFERLGQGKVYTAIGDIRAMANLPEVFMNAFNAIIVVLCCILYMYIVSPVGAGIVVAIIAVLLTVYLVRNNKIEKDLNIHRNLIDDYHRYLVDMLSGFKELKMNPGSNNRIYSDFLELNRKKSKDITISTNISYMNNELTGSYSWYVLFGVVIFLLPRFFGLSLNETSAFLITVLYLIGPVTVLVTIIPFYTNIKIAIQRLIKFNKEVSDTLSDELPYKNKIKFKRSFEAITFENVTYKYANQNDENGFSLGPINLTITPGELIFIVGGNGSGKSTFINLLTGLYRQSEGTIKFNDEIVTLQNHENYRDNMSAVFSSNYLFFENYTEHDISPNNDRLVNYLKQLRLFDLHFIPAKNTIHNNLSKGQQKRLGLVYALLDQKPMIILDEWAAEQDPEARKFFYEELLPKLRSSGKTVLLATHDDDYFHTADRILKFDYGKIASDFKTSLTETT